MSAADLERELGTSLPPDLATLTDADLARLAKILKAARHQQAAALAEATDRGLSFIPRLLRGPVTKVLFR
ncbi:MAG: hypothetical protein WB767_16250 [Nocardioides sp.]